MNLQFRFDGYCGQCGKNGNFVAIGPWSLMQWVRNSFLEHHSFHVPFEMKIQPLKGDEADHVQRSDDNM